MRPAISAHRGGGEGHRPETYAAYAAAAASGAEYVEFDVRTLADGTLVCYHDPLPATTYAALCATLGYEVPLVAEVMRLLAGHATAHIDLKEIGAEAVTVELAIDILGADFIVTSLEDVSLRVIRAAFPTVRTALSLGRGADGTVPWHRLPAMVLSELFPRPRLAACGANWAAIDKNLALAGVLRRCATAGIGTMVWTVDDDRRIDRLLRDPRVDVLITNRPRHALARRAALARSPLPSR